MLKENQFKEKLAEIRNTVPNSEFNKILIDKILSQFDFKEFMAKNHKDQRTATFSKMLKYAATNFTNNEDAMVNMCKFVLGYSLMTVNEENLNNNKDILQKLFGSEFATILHKNPQEQVEILIKKLSEATLEDLQILNPVLNLNLDYVDTFFEEHKLFFFSKTYEEYLANEKILATI